MRRTPARLPALLVLVVLLISATTTEAAFIVRSNDDDGWATGLSRYAPLRRLISLETRYRDVSTTSENGSINLNVFCDVLVADGTGHWKEVTLERPKLCVGGAVVLGTTAFAMGLDTTNSASLTAIQNVDTANPSIGSTVELPSGKLPVAIYTTPEGADPTSPGDVVYVALHDLDESVVQFDGFGASRSANLRNMMTYWEMLTHPEGLASQSAHVPHLTKLNPITGQVDWLALLETAAGTSGSSTISTMEYSEFSVLVCGSTNGVGDYFGPDSDNSWDGYVAFINPVTGNPDDIFEDPSGSIKNRPAIRIRSVGQGDNDFVHDMCLMGTDLYVVGTTEGIMSYDAEDPGGPFVVKIDTTRRIVTERIIVGAPNQTGLKIVCSDSHIYVGGHIIYPVNTQKEQDIFVKAYDKDLVGSQWNVIIDSTPYFGGQARRDQLVALEVNPALDINILWNSQVLEDGITEMVFMDLQGNTGDNEIQKGAKASASEAGVPEDGLEGLEDPVLDGDNNDPSDFIKNELDKIVKEDRDRSLSIGLGIGIPLALAVLVAIYTCVTNRKEGIDKSHPTMGAEEEIKKEGTPAAAVESSSAGVV